LESLSPASAGFFLENRARSHRAIRLGISRRKDEASTQRALLNFQAEN
jgi:hypothetical protein